MVVAPPMVSLLYDSPFPSKDLAEVAVLVSNMLAVQKLAKRGLSLTLTIQQSHWLVLFAKAFTHLRGSGLQPTAKDGKDMV